MKYKCLLPTLNDGGPSKGFRFDSSEGEGQRDVCILGSLLSRQGSLGEGKPEMGNLGLFSPAKVQAGAGCGGAVGGGAGAEQGRWGEGEGTDLGRGLGFKVKWAPW